MMGNEIKQRIWQRFPLIGLTLSLLLARAACAQVANPGFEVAGTSSSLAANWTVGQAAGGPVYAVRTNNNPHSGSFNFEVHLASAGAGPVVDFSQANVPVTGGISYPLTFYASALSGSAGYNAQWRVVWNTGGNTGFKGFTPGNNTYAFLSNNVIAPSGATSATVEFYIAGAAIASQSATLDIDDVSLVSTNVVANNNPLLISCVRGSSISWFATNNVTYQVQWSSNSGGSWNNLGDQISGNGSSNAIVDLSGPPHNFYQVISIQ